MLKFGIHLPKILCAFYLRVHTSLNNKWKTLLGLTKTRIFRPQQKVMRYLFMMEVAAVSK